MLKNLLIASIFFFFALIANAQAPFDAMSVEEVPIPASVQSTIDAQVPGARCYRVYVCMNEPHWELLQVFGFDAPPQVFPGFINLQDPATTRFYQFPGASASSNGVIASSLPFVPAMAYDSFFTIKRLTNVDNATQLAPGTWEDDFELTGGNVDLTDPVGGSWYMATDRSPTYDTNPPFDPIPGTYDNTIQNIPESDNRICIAQLTTNGIFDGQLSLRFRRLNPDRTLFLPNTATVINGATFTNFPPFVDLPCAIVFLPVEMLSFDATPDGDDVKITWITESEVNCDHFTIQRSKDALNWEDIKRVEGAGTVETRRYYTSIDEDPIPGISYYRLKQTDINGYSEFSEPVVVEFRHAEELVVYPNPAKDALFNIIGNTQEISSVRVVSELGKTVATFDINNELQTEISLHRFNLQAGMYLLEFTLDNGQRISRRWVYQP